MMIECELTSVLLGSALIIVTSLLIHRACRWFHTKPDSTRRSVRLHTAVYIHGMSSSFPPNCYRQTQMRDKFIENYCGGDINLSPENISFVHRLFSATLIQNCCVNLPEERLFSRMKRQEYTEYVRTTMLSLACESAWRAIDDSGGFTASQVTHLIFGTMTATIRAPSMDIYISQRLNLNPTVKRLNVEGMGCLTGFRLVGLARDIALECEDNLVLLVVCDIRSALGNQLTQFHPNQPIDRSNVIAAALFRDASGAALFSRRIPAKTSLSIVEHRSAIIANTLELAHLDEFDDASIRLYLDKELPRALFTYLPQFVTKLVEQHGIDIDRCQFAVHTGGPKIIRGIEKCLNLREEQLCASWYVMINYGNLSGSSNLVVVEHVRRWKYSSTVPQCSSVRFPSDFDRYRHVIGLSFGPGIGLECVLFRLE